jgi:hypothetical protein
MVAASPLVVSLSSLGVAGTHCAMASMDLAMLWLWFRIVLLLEALSRCILSCSLAFCP